VFGLTVVAIFMLVLPSFGRVTQTFLRQAGIHAGCIAVASYDPSLMDNPVLKLVLWREPVAKPSVALR
jgi:hypothetical protein